MSRITTMSTSSGPWSSTVVTGTLRDTFTVMGLTAVIFYRDWKLALYALVILPVAFLPVVEFGRRVRRVSTGRQESMADLSAFLHETFAGNKIVKAFGMEGYEKQRFFDKTLALFKLEMKAVVARSLSSPIMEFLGGLGIAFIIWYGGYRVISGASTAGTFFSFMAAVLYALRPGKKIESPQQCHPGGVGRRRSGLRHHRPTLGHSPGARSRCPAAGPPSGHLRDVHFRYDAVEVLTDINLDVRPGEIIALVGMSGGGKTTW